jgi:hypothetical protein
VAGTVRRARCDVRSGGLNRLAVRGGGAALDGIITLAELAESAHQRGPLLLQHGVDIRLSPAGAQAVVMALRRVEDLEAEMVRCMPGSPHSPRRQIACKTLGAELYGSGRLVRAGRRQPQDHASAGSPLASLDSRGSTGPGSGGHRPWLKRTAALN